jgi:hypothetical protein
MTTKTQTTTAKLFDGKLIAMLYTCGDKDPIEWMIDAADKDTILQNLPEDTRIDFREVCV